MAIAGMRKWLGILLLLTAGVCLAGTLALSAKVRSFPYRLNYEQGQVLHRMQGLWFASLALTGVAGAALISLEKNRCSRFVGWGCLLAVPVLFVFAPGYVHSITSGKNACINNLRQIDGAKEQWVMSNTAERRTVISLADLASYLRIPDPKCPEGGAYVIGKIDEVPQCSVKGHTL